MATKETCPLGEPHPPKPEAIWAFTEILPEVKKKLQHMRHDHDKHEPQFFAPVYNTTDANLTDIHPSSLKLVRTGTTAYGLFVFGKVQLKDPALYIHVRIFVAGDAKGENPKVVKLHAVHAEEKEVDGKKQFRAIFAESDPLEWFDE